MSGRRVAIVVRRRGWHRTLPVWLYSGVLWMAAMGIWLFGLAPLPPLAAPLHLGWPVLAVLFFIAERFIVDLEVREQTHSFSLSEIALMLGLIFATPGDVILGQALGAGAALLLRQGSRPVKLFFNLANFALATSVALVIFRIMLGGAEPLSVAGWLAAFMAGLGADLTGAGAVAVVIWLTQRERPRLGSLFGLGTAYMLVATSLALVAATVLWYAPGAAWLLLVLVALAYLGIRLHGRELRRQQSLIRLHESTRRLGESFSFDEVSRSLLTTAREMFEAAAAEIVIFPEVGDEGRQLRLSDHDAADAWAACPLDPREGVWARVSAEGRGLAIRPQSASHPVVRALVLARQRLVGGRAATSEKVLLHFAKRGIRSALVAPLRINEASIGTLLVGNRRGSSVSWSDDELTLFETLANHASVALHNSRQADELASQRDELERSATHDGLTGLPNRVHFHREMRRALDRREASQLAVLVMDLDRFKEVNDTLGHHNGDELLREVAARLGDALAPGTEVARLGGDEFAVLLERTDTVAAIGVAEQLLDALRKPLVVQGVTVQVEGSIGIVGAPLHGADADTLLRRADVAMYRAKADHARFAVYESERDPYSESRLALLAELRRAIEERELNVVFQPQAAAESGHIEGFEALLRWRHPLRGDLPPDEFIALAEHSELIHDLTRFVLEEAIGQLVRWRAAGHELRVSVNLSARNLLDATLADHIARLLADADLPPSALELEITETAIDADPVRSQALLGQLHELGVGIAIDDFGAGYSSFSYLARLPVNEIKIDRSFVSAMETDGRRLAIVRSTIQLGHNLGLRVVAEGVESESMRAQLVALGCDVIQGYLVGRAVSADLAGASLRRSLGDTRRTSARRGGRTTSSTTESPRRIRRAV